ncbi:MAG: hypothetical protein ACKO96_05270, partial [Flammeovirgaceae bacterium]
MNAILANVVITTVLFAAPHTFSIFFAAEKAIITFTMGCFEFAEMFCVDAKRVLGKILLPTVFTTIKITFLAAEKVHLFRF